MILTKSFYFLLQEKPRVSVKKFVKIGRPGYKGMEEVLRTKFYDLSVLILIIIDTMYTHLTVVCKM